MVAPIREIRITLVAMKMIRSRCGKALPSIRLIGTDSTAARGHRTTHAAQCTEGGETAQGDAAQPGRAFAAPAIDAQRQLPVAIDPAVADQHQHGGDRRHVGQQQRGTPEQVAVVVGHRLHDVRQLQAEQQEHHAVEGELQHRPDAAVEQARGSLPRQQVDPALHHAGRYRRGESRRRPGVPPPCRRRTAATASVPRGSPGRPSHGRSSRRGCGPATS